MGMTTPFPEPDSPELQRFAVQSQPEVVGLLRAVLDRGVPLNVFLGAGSAFDVMALRRVDEAAEVLVFDSPAEEGMRRRLLEAPTLTCVGFVDEVKLQFSACGARPATLAGRPAITMPMPARMLRLERRGSVRVRPPGRRIAVCRLPLRGAAGEYESLRVLDISMGGLAVLTYPERADLDVGMEIDGCRLDLPGVGGAAVSLRVRHIGPLASEDSARCCGCEFVRLAPAVQAMLARFVALYHDTACGSNCAD